MRRASKRRARRRTEPLIDPAMVLRSLASGLILGGLAYGLFLLLDQPLGGIAVEAPFQRVSALQIEAAMQPHLAGGFLSTDLARLRRSVEALPWIDRVRIRRVWPSGLRVSVTEQEAAARWGRSGLLNTRGELFMPEARHVPAELPELEGPDGSHWEVAQRYLDFQNQLLAAGLNIASLRLDLRGAWRLELGNGIEVRLGREAPDERLQRFLRAVTPLLGAWAEQVSYVDMRYANGFALGWREERPSEGENASDA